MANQRIIGFEIRPLKERSGRPGRKKNTEDQILRMEVPGGSVYLRKSTLQEAGDNWQRLKRRIALLSLEKDIPFTDYTVIEDA